MKHPKTVKSFLSACINLANTPTYDMVGSKRLTDDEQSQIAILSVVLQNELGAMGDILEKYDLEYK